MNEKKDCGFILFIIGVVLCVLLMIGSLIYLITKDIKTCFNFSVRYVDGTICEYHCKYFNNCEDFYELRLHDGTTLVLLKSSLFYVFINEVIDNEEKH